jgi:hypothetical protein
MKKQTILILAYTLVLALVVSVKIIETEMVWHRQITHGNLVACDDPPPPPPGGE